MKISCTGKEKLLMKMFYWHKYEIPNLDRIGAPVRVHLTENCEIIECSAKAEESIREAKSYEL